MGTVPTRASICPRCLADLLRPDNQGADASAGLHLKGPKFTLEIEAGQIIGRNSGCRKMLSGFSEISREHARFDFAEEKWSIRDLKSRNGTFLNGVRLKPGQEYRLKDGDRLGLSEELLFEVIIRN